MVICEAGQWPLNTRGLQWKSPQSQGAKSGMSEQRWRQAGSGAAPGPQLLVECGSALGSAQ